MPPDVAGKMVIQADRGSGTFKSLTHREKGAIPAMLGERRLGKDMAHYLDIFTNTFRSYACEVR
jgi:hypothetical protein